MNHFLSTPLVTMVDNLDKSVRINLHALAQGCAQVIDTGLYYSFNLVMLVFYFFDEMVEMSEWLFKDVQVMVHLAQNRNIN